MKKYITLFSLVILFIAGIQTIDAQAKQKQSLQAIAKQQTFELHQQVELTGEQQGAVFKLLLDIAQNFEAVNKKKNADIKQTSKIKTSLNERLNIGLKKILNKNQYVTYLETITENKKTAKGKQK